MIYRYKLICTVYLKNPVFCYDVFVLVFLSYYIPNNPTAV